MPEYGDVFRTVATEENRPSIARVLTLSFITVAIVFIASVSTIIYIGVGSTMTNMQESSIQLQIEQTKQHIDGFLDHYVLTLEDTARFPILIQSVMQPEAMEATLADFIGGVFVFGKRIQLVLLDYRGRLIHASQQDPIFDYRGQPWIGELTKGVLSRHVGLNRTEVGYFWRVAVPIRFNQQVEGILVAELPFFAIEQDHHEISSLLADNSRLEFHHKNRLIVAFGPELRTQAQDFSIPSLDLVLRFYWDRLALEQSRDRLLLKIIFGLSLLILLLLVLSLLSATRYLAKPLGLLRALTHSIATKTTTERAPENFLVSELMLLAKDFNLMADKIYARERSLENEVHERREAEAALLKSEKGLATAQRIAHVGNWEHNLATDERHWSNEIFRIFEIDPEERGASYDAFLNTVHPDDREIVKQAYTEYLKKVLPYNITYRLLMPDGRIKYVEELCQPSVDKQDNPLISIGTVQDITAHKQAEKVLRESQQRKRLHIQQTPLAVIEWNTDFKVVEWNPAAEKIFGYARDEALGRSATELVIPKSAQVHVDELWHELLANKGGLRSTNENTTKEGKRILCEWYNTPLVDESGKVVGVASLAEDISLRKQAENALFEEKERAQVTLHSIGDAVISTDADGRVDFLNPIAETLTGWPAEEAEGRLMADVFKIINEENREPAQDPVAHCLREGKIIGLANHTVLLNRSGREYAIEDSAAPIFGKDGEVLGVVLVFKDVTKARQLSQQISYQATHDALTGLINRGEFERRLRRVLETAHTEYTENVLCYLDLDQFKLVNDTCGHVAGDELLRQLGKLLKGHIRKRDTLARLGGDEFGLLMEHCSLKEAQGVAENLIKIMGEFIFPWEDHSFSIGVSIGMVSIDRKSTGIVEIFSAADTACYLAKEKGRNRIHIHKMDDKELIKRHGEMQWAARLPRALERDQFQLYYQPIIPVTGGNNSQTNHYELLLRMEDETGKLVPPGAFLPAAERYNLSDKIDRWIIKHAFEWLEGHPEHLRQLDICSINLSGLSLSDKSFLPFVIEELKASSISPRKICFEITETVAIANLTSATAFITALRKLGCHFALDDFGSGLSSFAYLKNLPVDFLKIDGLFVKDILDDPMDLAMVRSINEIGQLMGKKTIAEFVENDSILEKLRVIGVDYAQGYGIGRPKPLDEVLSYQC